MNYAIFILGQLRSFVLWLLLMVLLGIATTRPAHAQTSPSLTFTLETSTPDGKSVVPRLTWATSPAAQGCTASGSTDWTGAKSSSGTVLLAAVNASKTYGIACTWPGITKVGVAWIAPTTNSDGTPYTNPGGYRMMWGNKSAAEADLDQTFYIQDPAARTWTSPALAAGTWWFGVKAYNALGLESALSNVASKATTAAANQSRTLELTIHFPSPPSNVTVQ